MNSLYVRPYSHIKFISECVSDLALGNVYLDVKFSLERGGSLLNAAGVINSLIIFLVSSVKVTLEVLCMQREIITKCCWIRKCVNHFLSILSEGYFGSSTHVFELLK